MERVRWVTPLTAPSSKEDQNVTDTFAGGFKPTSAHASWGWAMMRRFSGRGCPTDISDSPSWDSVYSRDIRSFA